MARFLTSVVTWITVAGFVACGSSSSSNTAVDGAAGMGGAAGTGVGGSGVDSGADVGPGGAPVEASVDAAGGTGGTGVLEGAVDAPTCVTPTPEGTCGSFPQCGCGVGDKCEVVDLTTGRTQCVADGTVIPFHGCSSFLGIQCLAGSVCIFGACKPFCRETSDCLGAFQECRPIQANVGGMDVTVPGTLACSAGCDPVAPADVCGPGLSCFFVDGVTECITAGTAMGIGACGSGNTLDCAPGYLCVNDQMTGSMDCLKWCRMGNPNDCNTAGGEVCAPLNTTPTFNGTQYGVCLVP